MLAFFSHRFNRKRRKAWKRQDRARAVEGMVCFALIFGLWWAGVATVPVMWAVATFWR